MAVDMILSLTSTILIYLGFMRLYVRSGKKLYLNPMILCPITIGMLLIALDIPYHRYAEGGSMIAWMLQPATVAFAVPLYRYRKTVKLYGAQMATAVALACVVAIATSAGLVMLVGLGKELAMSIAPRSATTPLAMAASGVMGGDQTITAVLVIATGVMGMIMTALFIERQRIHNTLLKGLLFGITAHGTGAAKAYEDGPKTGAIASLAMIFMGVITTLVAPAVAHLAVFFE